MWNVACGVWNVECGVRIPSGVVPFAPILFLYLFPYLIIISHSTLLTPHSSSLSIISPSSFLLRPSSGKIRPSSGKIPVPNRIHPPMPLLITAQFHLHLSSIRQGNGLPLPALSRNGKHSGAAQRCEEGIDYLSTWFHLQYSSPYRLFSKFLEISSWSSVSFSFVRKRIGLAMN